MLKITFGILLMTAFTVARAEDSPATKTMTQQNVSHEGVGAVKMSRVKFTAPKDGGTVEKEFTAKFSIEGLKVKPAGQIEPGTGHFHVIIDDKPVAEGQVVPTDATHLHFGKGQMETKLTLAPGPHTLTLQFADGAHRAYDLSLVDTIKINVK